MYNTQEHYIVLIVYIYILYIARCSIRATPTDTHHPPPFTHPPTRQRVRPPPSSPLSGKPRGCGLHRNVRADSRCTRPRPLPHSIARPSPRSFPTSGHPVAHTPDANWLGHRPTGHPLPTKLTRAPQAPGHHWQRYSRNLHSDVRVKTSKL
jgi:hypothetical protein